MSSSRTETSDTLKKKIPISSVSVDDKDTKKQQPTEIKFINDRLRSDNPSVSIMSVHGASIKTVSPDKDCIPRKIKKETLRNLDHR